MSVSFKLADELSTYYTVEGWSSSVDIEALMKVKPPAIETWRKLYFKRTKVDSVSGRKFYSYFSCALSVSGPLSPSSPLGVWDVVLTHFVNDSRNRKRERLIDWTVDFETFSSSNIRLYLIHQPLPGWSAIPSTSIDKALELAVRNGAATELYTNKFFDINLFLQFIKDARNGINTPVGTTKAYANVLGGKLEALRLT